MMLKKIGRRRGFRAHVEREDMRVLSLRGDGLEIGVEFRIRLSGTISKFGLVRSIHIHLHKFSLVSNDHHNS